MANKITVTSAGTVVNANVTPDTAMYYSNKSREWAISDRIVDNTDYSSKYYANESKKQADISTAKAAEVIESGNTAVSNIESARDIAITDITNQENVSVNNVNTAGATQVSSVNTAGITQVANVNSAGTTQINLAKEQVTLATNQANIAKEQATIATNKANEVVASGNEALINIDTAKNNAITSITNQETTSKTSLIDEGATQVGLIQNEGAKQVANVQSTGFYMRDDKLYFINSQGEETEFKSGGGGLPVGTIFSHTCSASFVPENSLPCDGAEYAQAQFPTLYTDWLVGGRLNTCTYEEYQEEITATGECLKIALDTINKKFKVPTKKNEYLQDVNISNTIPVAGNGIALGMTSGGAYYGTAISSNNLSLYTGNYGGVVGASRFGSQVGATIAMGVTTDASKSGIVAYSSNALTINKIAIRYFIVVATGAINQSEMDWSAWASEISIINARPYIIETYRNGSSWYRLWSDNWCEQGGLSAGLGSPYGVSTITLLKPYKDINYWVQGSIIWGSGTWYTDSFTTGGNAVTDVAGPVADKTNASFNIQRLSPHIWYACGYIA